MSSFLHPSGNPGVPHNRPGNELRKHGDVSRQIYQIPFRPLASVHIQRIADNLKRIKTDSDRKGRLYQRNLLPGNRTQIFKKKISVLKIQEKGKADSHRQDTNQPPGAFASVLFKQQPENPAGQYGNHHQNHIPGLAPGIKYETAQKKNNIFCLSRRPRLCRVQYPSEYKPLNEI